MIHLYGIVWYLFLLMSAWRLKANDERFKCASKQGFVKKYLHVDLILLLQESKLSP